MTHDELLERVSDYISSECDCESCNFINGPYKALRAVVELHKNYRLDGIYYECSTCGKSTTHCLTIKAIKKELQ